MLTVARFFCAALHSVIFCWYSFVHVHLALGDVVVLPRIVL